MLPGFFVMVLPITLLLALLYALTHHARHNEITALRAAGVGLWRLCAPYFIVGLLATGIYFALNEMVVPRCERWANEILSRHVKKETEAKSKTRFGKGDFHNLRAHRVWRFSEYDAASARMVNPNVTWTLADGSLRSVLRAERASRTNGVWIFSNAQLMKPSGPHGELMSTSATNLNALAMPEFDETPEQILIQLKFSDTQTLRGSRSADIPLAELWDYLRNNPNLLGGKIAGAAHQISPAHRRAVDVPGGGADRDSVRRAVGPAQSFLRRGRQHFHLLRLFRAADRSASRSA